MIYLYACKQSLGGYTYEAPYLAVGIVSATPP